MKSVLSFGLDQSALDEKSALASRLRDFGKITEKYTLIVPAVHTEEIPLANNVKVIGIEKGNKLVTLYKVFFAGRKLLKKEKFDLITVQDIYYVAWVALCLSKIYKVPLQIQIHGFEKYFLFRKWIAQYVVRKAQSIRTVSERFKKKIIEEFNVAPERIHVIPVFSEQKAFVADVIRPRGKQEGEFVFLIVARLVPVKNIQLALKAIAEVSRDFPQARLWIIGDGEEREKLMLRTQKLGLQKIVSFKGFQKELQPFYAASDCLLITSKAEGWGMVAVEAAQNSLPVIMTDVGLAGEFVVNGENGLVVPVGDLKALVYAMKNIIDDPQLKAKLGANNKAALSKLPDKSETLLLYQKSFEETTF